MTARIDVKMAHMQYELMFQNDVGCDMCVLVAMFDIAMFPSDREGVFLHRNRILWRRHVPEKILC